MTDIEKIVKIIENSSPELAAEEILLLFSVSNRRELLIAFASWFHDYWNNEEKYEEAIDYWLEHKSN